MKPNPSKSLALLAAGCLGLPLSSQAAELIDSSTINSIAAHNWGNRQAWRTLNGSVASNIDGGGTLATDNSLYLDAGGSMNADDPTAWLLDGTAGGTTATGNNTCWSGQGHNQTPTKMWIIYDLGSDTKLDSMNVWNIQVTDPVRTNRSVNQADVFYRPASAGTPSNNTNADSSAFDPTGWIIVGAAGTQTFPETTVSDTMAAPTNVSFGSVTARWVAIAVETSHGDGATAGLGEVQFFLDDTAPIDDPALNFDPANEQNFEIGNVFGDTTYTVTFVNDSDQGSGIIDINGISITDDGGNGGPALFGTPTVTYSGTSTLADGDTVTIEIPVMGASAAAGSATGEITIDTTSSGGNVGADFNDKVIAITATVYADGERLNPNPFLEAGLADWDVIGATGNAESVSPGIAGGSSRMARVKGKGDASNTDPGVDKFHYTSFMQSTGLPNGATDWQFSAFFTPINGSDANFVKYVNPNGADAGITGPDGSFADRTFQWVLLSADTGRPFPEFGNGQAAGTLINIAYMPDGITTGGTPDFYVFDGSTGAWQPTGIGAIDGSVDNDTDANEANGIGDGLLDDMADPLDVINSYRLLVTGTGFGTPAASYTVKVSKFSGPDTFPVAGVSSGPLSFFHGVSGMTGTPAGYSFITSDISDGVTGNPNFGSNPGDGTFDGFMTPFWVDDITFYNNEAPDPNLTILSTPGIIAVESPATTGTTTITIRNDGTSTDLQIDPSTFVGGTGFSVTDPVGAFTVIPGALQDIEITWDSAAASADFESTTITLADSTNGFSSDFDINAGIAVAHASALDNGDFEILGTDPDTGGNTDNFESWDELTGTGTAIPEGAINVPGLITGTGVNAAYMSASPRGEMVATLTTPLNNFEVNMDFAVKSGGRAFNVYFKAIGPTDTDINLRYQGGIWYVFEDVESGGGWVQVLSYTLTPSEDNDANNSLEDPGDVKVTYKLKMVGSGWGTTTPSYSFEVQDSTGATLATTAKLEIWRNNIPTEGTARLNDITLSSQWGGNNGSWTDNITVSGQTMSTDPVVVEDFFSITAFSIDKSTGMGSVTFSPTTAGTTYEVRASNDTGIDDPYSANLIESVQGVDGETTIPFTDAAAPTAPVRTYRVNDVEAP